MASDGRPLRVAAIGDLHVQEDSVAPYRELFTEISSHADVLLLCGDLTNFGKTSEAEILAEDIKSCAIPVLGVLGNHDYECGQPEKVCEILHGACMVVLDEQAHEIDGVGEAPLVDVDRIVAGAEDAAAANFPPGSFDVILIPKAL